MPKIIGIEHIVLHVGNLEKSRRFYDAVLGFLGFKLEWEFGRVLGWDNGDTMVWIREAGAAARKRKFRLGDIGFHHYAFELARSADVDALHEFLKQRKITIVDPPADYPSYGEGYYAVYFLDPDGMKFEAVYFEEKRKRRARRRRKKAV
jgi:catechol 2,3-dioxygenase-like lactoylglutathione lyase family enzyme